MSSSAQSRPSALAADPWSWRAAFRVAWSAYWPLRLLLLALGALGALLAMAAQPQSLGGWLDRLFLSTWNYQDMPWYLKIAEHGYAVPDGRAAFHPLLPLLMGGLGRVLGGQFILAGFIVNDLACLGALAAFYKLAGLDHDQKAARNALDWLLYNPVGFVLLIPYTEALALCFILLSFWFARNDRWLAAGLSGALATLAKQPAMVLPLVLLIEYVSRRRGRLLSWRSAQVLASLALIGLGYLAYSAYRLILDPLVNPSAGEFVQALVVSPRLSAYWGSRSGSQFEWVAKIVEFALAPDTYGWFWIELALTLLGLFLVACSLRRSRLSVAAYSLIMVFLITTIILPGDALMSTPRRFMLIFAVFIELGLWSSRSASRHRWRLVGLAVQVVLVLGFVMGKYVP
ncbi:MAG TPA: hypothetical protein VD886_08915 [Herpetosiphonaceae bacterium]|nr:hypothetical protein [Herpetosiphonaceae bacterium]